MSPAIELPDMASGVMALAGASKVIGSAPSKVNVTLDGIGVGGSMSNSMMWFRPAWYQFTASGDLKSHLLFAIICIRPSAPCSRLVQPTLSVTGDDADTSVTAWSVPLVRFGA